MICYKLVCYVILIYFMLFYIIGCPPPPLPGSCSSAAVFRGRRKGRLKVACRDCQRRGVGRQKAALARDRLPSQGSSAATFRCEIFAPWRRPASTLAAIRAQGSRGRSVRRAPGSGSEPRDPRNRSGHRAFASKIFQLPAGCLAGQIWSRCHGLRASKRRQWPRNG